MSSIVELLVEVLVELSVREESLLEHVNYGLLVGKWDGDLLSVDVFDIFPQCFLVALLNAVEVSKELF